MARTSLNALRSRAERLGLRLSCQRLEETRCRVVLDVEGTTGITDLSPLMNLRMTDMWLDGFESCFHEEHIKKRRL